MTDAPGPTDGPTDLPASGPTQPDAPTEPTTQLAGPGAVQPPDVSEMVPAEPVKRRRRWFIPAAGVAALALVASGATWAAFQLMSSGDPVTTALPDSTLAFVSVDLDPSASQKIEAIKVMQKIPALSEHLGFDLKPSDDLRTWIADELAKASGCTKFDYATQVAPWIGDRAAFAGAENADGKVVPLAVVQVTDQAKARAGFKTDGGCTDTGTSGPDGLAFVGQYALLTDTQQDADYLAAEATKSPLEKNADYQKWMGRVGDPGIITAYAAPDALSAAIKSMGAPAGLGPLPGLGSLQDAASKFTGAAAAVRFSSGGVELEVVGDAKNGLTGTSATGSAPVAQLPDTTAIALGVALPNGWQDKVWSNLTQSDPNFDQGLKQFERGTGLKLPDDLVALLGNGFALSVDKSLDPNTVMNPRTGAPDFSQLPVGLRITGDPSKITGVVEKLNRLLGAVGTKLVAVPGNGVVGLSTSPAYATELSKNGGLGDTAAYQAAVEQGVDSPAVEYIDLSAVGNWVSSAAGSDPSGQELARNLGAFVSVGASSWDSNGIAHGLLRITLR